MIQFGSAALGSLLGGSLGLGSRAGWMLGSLLGSQFGKKPVIEGRRLDDMSVQASTYGKAIPLIYGRAVLKGNIIWTSGIEEMCTTTKQRVSVLSKVKVKDYTYKASLALGLCEGETQGLQRIWANGQLIYDQTQSNAGKVKSFPFEVRFYSGSETQMPDPLITRKEGHAPAFRGLTYVVFEDFPLGEFNNAVPRFTFEVSRSVMSIPKVIEVQGTDHASDNICRHPDSPWLFLRERNKICVVDRDLNRIEKTIDFTERLPRTDLHESTLCGALVFDPQGALYAFAQHHLSSFVVKIDPFTGQVLAHNFEARIIADEQIGYVDGPFLYTADFLKGIIRVYQSSDLSRLYEIPGAIQTGLHLRPTNFTKDGRGRIWLASFDPTNNRDAYLTKLRGQDAVDHYSLEGYGQASGVVYDAVLERIILCCHEGLLILHPETGQVEHVMQEIRGYSTGFSQSTFLNCPVTRGSLWLAKYGEAILVHLSERRIAERIPFEASFRACSFDEEQNALWFKGGGLSKMLLGRKDVQSLNLPEVVAHLMRRGGVRGDELQIELNNDPVRGLVIPHPIPLSKALSPLKQGHFFHLRQHGGRLQCFYPEAALPVQINATDVGCFIEKGRGEEGVVTEAHEDLPRCVEVLYPSTDRQLGVGTQKAEWQSKKSGQSLRLELPLLMTDQEARHVADKVLLLAWQRRRSIIFTLPLKYEYLEVGDVVEIKEGCPKRILITELTQSPYGLIEVEGWELT